MSQYPSPYQPYPAAGQQPGHAYTDYQKYLSRFSRAGMMLFVTGALMLLSGGLCVGAGAVMPWDKVLEKISEQAAQNGQALPPQATAPFMQAVCIAFGVGSFVLGLAQIILGIFVRKSGIVSTVLAIVLTSLVVAILLFILVRSGLEAAMNPQNTAGPNLVAGICMFSLPLALSILQLVWLGMAAKGYSALQTAKAQYNAQYWQYVQAQQGFVQPPLGIPQPPPGQGPVGGYGGSAGVPIPPPPDHPK